MLQRIKKLLKFAVVIAILLGVGLGAANRYLNTKLEDAEFLGNLVTQALGPGFTGKVTLGKAVFEAPRKLHLKNLKIEAPGQPKPLVFIEQIEVIVRLKDLFDSHLNLIRLSLVGLSSNLTRRPDGSFVLPFGGPPQQVALPGPGGAGLLLASAGTMPGTKLTIDSLEIEKGNLEITDQKLGETFSLSNFSSRMAVADGNVKIEMFDGKLLSDFPVQVEGDVDLMPSLAADLLIRLSGIDLSIVQSRIKLLAGLKGMGVSLVGNVPLNLKVMATGKEVSIESQIQFNQVGLDGGAMLGTKVSIESGSGTVNYKPGKTGTTFNLSLASVYLEPVNEGVTLPMATLEVAGQLNGNSISLSKVQGLLGSGGFEMTGSLDNFILPNLLIDAFSIPLDQIMPKVDVTEANSWLKLATVSSLKGEYAGGVLNFAPAELVLGNSTMRVAGKLRPANAGGYEPEGVAGSAQVAGEQLAGLLGFANPEAMRGTASLEFTANPDKFAAEVKSQGLAVDYNGILLDFDGLAAAVNGVRGEQAGQFVTAWASNVAAGSFRFNWPVVLRGLGLPLEGAVNMKTGQATVTSDPSGIRISNFRCDSDLIRLAGKMHIGPSGVLSGEIDAEAFSTPGVLLKRSSAQLYGMIQAPKITVR